MIAAPQMLVWRHLGPGVRGLILTEICWSVTQKFPTFAFGSYVRVALKLEGGKYRESRCRTWSGTTNEITIPTTSAYVPSSQAPQTSLSSRSNGRPSEFTS